MAVHEAQTEVETRVSEVPRRAWALSLLFRPGDRLNAILLALLGAVAAGVRFNDQLIGLTGDNAQYMLLGLALATGKPYANGEYPWGYPLVIAPVVGAFGEGNLLAAIPWLKLLTIALLVVSIVLVYALFRADSSALVAFVPALMFAVNSTALLYANDVMTEIPYTCVSLAALLYWRRKIAPWLQTRSGVGQTAWGTVIVGALLLAVPYYFRTVGLALIGAGVLALLFGRRLRAALVVAGLCAMVSLPWAVFSSGVDQPTYTSKLLLRDPYNPSLGRIDSPLEFGRRIVSTADLYIRHVFPAMVFPDPTPEPVRAVLGTALVLLMLVGLGWRLAKGRGLDALYALLFSLVLFAWPWKADRFLLPIYPLLVFYAVEGLRLMLRPLRLEGRLGVPVRATLVASVVLLVALPSLWLAGTAGAENLRYLKGEALPSGHTPDWQGYFAACAWIKANTPPGSVVISRKSTLTTIYAGRPSVLIPLIPPVEYQEFVAENNVSYVLEDAFDWSTQTEQYLRPALKAYPSLFELETTVGPVPTRIWKVMR